MKGAVLQPTYLPWMGFFEMLSSTDVYVVFDHVQFERKSWQQRNKIKTPNGEMYLSVPVKKCPQKTRICDVRVSYDRGNFLEDHWKTITNSYKRAPYFKKYQPIFEEIYNQKPTLLRDLNVSIIKTICGILGIGLHVVYSSDLNLADEQMGKTEKVINLCRHVGIGHLYDANGAQFFLDADLFKQSGVKITFQNFTPPKYNQLWGEWIPFLSAIDLIFNEGDNAYEIMRSGRGQVAI